jgi:hypothetical protein
MAEPTDGGAAPVPSVARCPWCSAELPRSRAKTCPNCKANLAGAPEAALPGLTAIDLEKLAFRRSVSPKRSRLMSWISGDLDYEDAGEPAAPPGSLEPPAADVRREMLRLEMAAMIADLTAEAGALAADEAVARGDDPVAAAAAVQAEVDAAARSAELEAAPTDLATPVVAEAPETPASGGDEGDAASS